MTKYLYSRQIYKGLNKSKCRTASDNAILSVTEASFRGGKTSNASNVVGSTVESHKPIFSYQKNMCMMENFAINYR